IKSCYLVLYRLVSHFINRTDNQDNTIAHTASAAICTPAAPKTAKPSAISPPPVSSVSGAPAQSIKDNCPINANGVNSKICRASSGKIARSGDCDNIASTMTGSDVICAASALDVIRLVKKASAVEITSPSASPTN